MITIFWLHHKIANNNNNNNKKNKIKITSVGATAEIIIQNLRNHVA
jgi:hypothetical protein